MKNFVVRYLPSEKEFVLNLIRNFSNDIIIDTVEDDRVTITVQLGEDEESDQVYVRLEKEIAYELERRKELQLD